MKEQLSTESHSSWAWKAPLKITSALFRAGPAKAGCPEPCTFRFWTSPMVVTPSHLHAQAALVPDCPSQCNQKKGVFYCFTLKPNLLPCHWLPWEESLCLLYIEKIPKTFSSLHSTVPACSASPHSTGDDWWLWWPLAGLPAEHPCLQLRSPEVDTALQRSLKQLTKLCPEQPLRLLAAGAHCWLTDNVVLSEPFAQSCFPAAWPCSLRSSQLS